MTARATITQAAMRAAIEAARQGVRVTVHPDGTLIVEPMTATGHADTPFDIWKALRDGQGQS